MTRSKRSTGLVLLLVGLFGSGFYGAQHFYKNSEENKEQSSGNTEISKENKEKIRYPEGSLVIKTWFEKDYERNMNVVGVDIIDSFFNSKDQFYKKEDNSRRKIDLLDGNAKDENLPDNLKDSKESIKGNNIWRKNYILRWDGPNCDEIEKDLNDYFKYRTKDNDQDSPKMWLNNEKIYHKVKFGSSLFPIPLKEVNLVRGGLSCKII